MLIYFNQSLRIIPLHLFKRKIMMVLTPPSLPTINGTPYRVAIDALLGFTWSKLGQTNPKLTTLIFAIRSIVDTFFYHAVNYVKGTKELESQKIYLITSTMVNMIFVVALRELNVIGQLFSCLLGVAALGYMINRIAYIQSVEQQAILEGKEIT